MLDAQSAWIIGVAFTETAWPTTSASLLELRSGAGVQLDLTQHSDGTLEVRRNGASLTGGRSSQAVTLATYHYLEWFATVSNSIGASQCVVKVNGVVWIDVAAGQDTQAGTTATADRIFLGDDYSAAIGATYDYDDLYICDTTGTECNTFLGDVRVDALFPTLSGTVSAWSPSSAGMTGVSMINSAAPDTTTYLYASTVSDLQRFLRSSLASAGGSVYGVQLCLAVAKSDAGTREAAALLYASATSGQGTSAALATTYAYLGFS